MKTYAELEGVYVEPGAGGAPKSLVVILHGWGADCHDLAGLARPMGARLQGAAFFVPNAPDPCSVNPMGREWFDLAESMDGPGDGPGRAGGMIEASLRALCADLGIGMEAVALVGFSQGGMMSLHCGIGMAEAPAAVASFSGALMGASRNAGAGRRPKVLLVHGTNDEVVPFAMMERASAALGGFGIEAICVERPGLGHGIDPEGLERATEFLATHLPG